MTSRPEKRNRDGSFLRVESFKGHIRDGCPCFEYEFYDNRYMYYGNIFKSRYENIKFNHEIGFIMAMPYLVTDCKYVKTDQFDLGEYKGTYGLMMKTKGVRYIFSSNMIVFDGMSIGGKSLFKMPLYFNPQFVGDYYLYDLGSFSEMDGIYLGLKTLYDGDFRLKFFGA